MDNIQLPVQSQETQITRFHPSNIVHPLSLEQLHMFQYYRMCSIYSQQMINKQYYSRGFRLFDTQQAQQHSFYSPNHQFQDRMIKVQEGFDQQMYLDGYGQQSKQSESNNKMARIINKCIIKNNKIRKMKKNIQRNTEKNLLVHLKLWLQKYIQQKSQFNPEIRKQFEFIFTSGSKKSSKDVYMNLYLFSQVLQNERLRPCLSQFFQKRILRYLMNSNIQNKGCIVKYCPILLKKYKQGYCQSLKP